MSFVQVEVPDGAIQVGCGLPCPCGEGVVSFVDYAGWTMKHVVGRGCPHFEHKMPAVVYNVTQNSSIQTGAMGTTVLLRRKPSQTAPSGPKTFVKVIEGVCLDGITGWARVA